MQQINQLQNGFHYEKWHVTMVFVIQKKKKKNNNKFATIDVSF